MTQRTFLDYNGLQRFLNNLKTIIPTKTSDITNDSGFLTQHNPVDSSLSDTSENAVQNKVVKGALDGKSDTGHTHLASEVSGLSTVATSGSYNDLSNTPTIPTVNNATLTIQKNGTTVKTFTANASSNVTANITVPTAVSELTNDSGFLTSASSLDSSKLTGTIDIARLPKGALERLVTVANQTARFALTASDVQLGDTVKQLDTGVMYIVTDESKLSSADGYTEYTAGSATSVPWSGVTGKPSSFTPSSHTHGNVTNDGKLPTASRALISDSSKKITVSSVTDTELGYLSGVTSSVQTQLNGKATDSGVVHLTGTESISGDKTFITGLNISNDDTSQSTPQIYLRNYKNSRSSTTLTGTQSINFNDKDNNGLGYLAFKVTSLGNTVFDLATLQTGDNNSIIYGGLSYIARTTSNDSFVPSKNNLVDLGSSSYKWNKIYSDDVVHTSGNESVSGTKSFNSDLNLNYASTDVDDIVNSVAGSATLDNFVHMTGNETVSGIKSFPDGVIANVTGSATSAINDGSGNVISSTYGKLGAVNTWGMQNTFINLNPIILKNSNIENGVQPTNFQAQHILFKDKNGSNVAYIRHVANQSGTTNTFADGLEFSVQNKFANGVLDPTGTNTLGTFRIGFWTDGQKYVYNEFRWRSSLIPFNNQGQDIGTSTNQWNNLYAKNYYYNGTPWGLDKANVWSNNNTFSKICNIYNSDSTASTPVLKLQNSKAEVLSTGNTPSYQSLIFCEKNDYCFGRVMGMTQSNGVGVKIASFAQDANDDTVMNELQIMSFVDGSKCIFPSDNGQVHLGVYHYKWKTFNGLNPGALSLPKIVAKTSADISSAIVGTDGETQYLDGTSNFYTTALDGWISICISGFTQSNELWITVYDEQNETWGTSGESSTSSRNTVFIIFPIRANQKMRIRMRCTAVDYARFYPCEGNV